jgi:hypothetical protein
MHRRHAGEPHEIAERLRRCRSVDHIVGADVPALKADAIAEIEVHGKRAIGKDAETLRRQEPGHEVVTLPRLAVMNAVVVAIAIDVDRRQFVDVVLRAEAPSVVAADPIERIAAVDAQRRAVRRRRVEHDNRNILALPKHMRRAAGSIDFNAKMVGFQQPVPVALCRFRGRRVLGD